MRLREAAHGLAGDEVFAGFYRVFVGVDAVTQGGGIDRAGRDGVAANALGHMVGGHCFGQADHGCFARAVHQAVGQALDTAAHAGHVDDAGTSR